MSAAASGLLQFWRWWTSELKGMLPTSLAGWIDGEAVATDVAVDERGLTIIHTSAGTANAASAQTVPMDQLSISPALRTLVSAGREQVRLVLTPEQALVKTITLPLATEENLREVIGFELDRHTPFTLEQAYYDVQVVRRDPQSEKITVSLAVASKSEIAALLDTLRRAGLSCRGIGIDAAVASNAAAFDLQPAFDKPARRLSRMHLLNLALLALAALLVFAAVILPIWQKRETVKALLPLAQKSGAEFVVSERVYSEYTKLVSEYNYVATRKHATYPVVAVLEDLAKTFPDTTWVTRLDIKSTGKTREVTLQGETQSASKVIENLEQSPSALFQNSKQLTQTTRMQPNTERFHVSAEIKPRPVPAAESIDVAATPAAVAPFPAPIATVPPATATVTSVPAASAGVPGAPAQAAPVVPTEVPAARAGQPAPRQAGATPLSTFNGPPPTAAPAAKAPAAAPGVPPTAPAAKRSGP